MRGHLVNPDILYDLVKPDIDLYSIKSDEAPLNVRPLTIGCMRVNSRSTYLMVVQTVAYSTTAH